MEQLKRKAKIVDTSNKDSEKPVQFIGGNHLENIATSGAVSRYYEWRSLYLYWKNVI